MDERAKKAVAVGVAGVVAAAAIQDFANCTGPHIVVCAAGIPEMSHAPEREPSPIRTMAFEPTITSTFGFSPIVRGGRDDGKFDIVIP
jgi:hypothetical protein